MKNKEPKVLGDVDSFVVNRKNWLRGEANWESFLRNDEGKMCCLGFYAKSCGLKNEDIVGRLEPFQVEEDLVAEEKVWNTKLLSTAKKTCNALMLANDSVNLTDEGREKKITSLFNSIGIEVKFKG